jgi:Cu/Ag efflux protein CusF
MKIINLGSEIVRFHSMLICFGANCVRRFAPFANSATNPNSYFSMRLPMPLIVFILSTLLSLSACSTRLESFTVGHTASSGPVGIVVRQVNAYGRVISVKPSENLIEIKHAPIPDLNWAPMLMSFDLAPGFDLNAFQRGDLVNFVLELDKDNNFRIKHLSLK